MLLLERDEGKIKMSVQPNEAQSWIRLIIVDLSNSAVMQPCSEKAGFASVKKAHPQNRNPQQQKKPSAPKPKKLPHFK